MNSVGADADCGSGILIYVVRSVPNSRLGAGGYYCVPRRRDRLREWAGLGYIQIAAPWFETSTWDDLGFWDPPA